MGGDWEARGGEGEGRGRDNLGGLVGGYACSDKTIACVEKIGDDIEVGGGWRCRWGGLACVSAQSNPIMQINIIMARKAGIDQKNMLHGRGGSGVHFHFGQTGAGRTLSGLRALRLGIDLGPEALLQLPKAEVRGRHIGQGRVSGAMMWEEGGACAKWLQ